jgi:hypothetical protein
MRQAEAAAEADNARMFEKPADDALDPDIVRQPRNAGPETADAANDEIDLDAGIAGNIKGVDDARIDEGVELGPDLRRATRLGVGDLLLDVLEEALL